MSMENKDIKTAEHNLEQECPSFSDLFMDEMTRDFRARIIKAMESYASQQVNLALHDSHKYADGQKELLNDFSKKLVESQKRIEELEEGLRDILGQHDAWRHHLKSITKEAEQLLNYKEK